MTHGSRFLIQSKSRDIKGSSDLMASSFSLITHSGTKGVGGKLILLKKLILLCKNKAPEVHRKKSSSPIGQKTVGCQREIKNHTTCQLVIQRLVFMPMHPFLALIIPTKARSSAPLSLKQENKCDFFHCLLCQHKAFLLAADTTHSSCSKS